MRGQSVKKDHAVNTGVTMLNKPDLWGEATYLIMPPFLPKKDGIRQASNLAIPLKIYQPPINGRTVTKYVAIDPEPVDRATFRKRVA